MTMDTSWSSTESIQIDERTRVGRPSGVLTNRWQYAVSTVCPRRQRISMKSSVRTDISRIDWQWICFDTRQYPRTWQTEPWQLSGIAQNDKQDRIHSLISLRNWSILKKEKNLSVERTQGDCHQREGDDSVLGGSLHSLSKIEHSRLLLSQTQNYGKSFLSDKPFLTAIFIGRDLEDDAETPSFEIGRIRYVLFVIFPCAYLMKNVSLDAKYLQWVSQENDERWR